MGMNVNVVKQYGKVVNDFNEDGTVEVIDSSG